MLNVHYISYNSSHELCGVVIVRDKNQEEIKLEPFDDFQSQLVILHRVLILGGFLIKFPSKLKVG